MTQVKKILSFLTKTTNYPGKLTSQLAAEKLDVERLSARIYEIRNLGFTVYTNTKTTKNGKVNVYRLAPSQKKDALRFAKSA